MAFTKVGEELIKEAATFRLVTKGVKAAAKSSGKGMKKDNLSGRAITGRKITAQKPQVTEYMHSPAVGKPMVKKKLLTGYR